MCPRNATQRARGEVEKLIPLCFAFRRTEDPRRVLSPEDGRPRPQGGGRSTTSTGTGTGGGATEGDDDDGGGT